MRVTKVRESKGNPRFVGQGAKILCEKLPAFVQLKDNEYLEAVSDEPVDLKIDQEFSNIEVRKIADAKKGMNVVHLILSGEDGEILFSFDLDEWKQFNEKIQKVSID